ncbi:hypothetical protein HK100_005217 [Physocladia obscura]|uniref:Uncharacterized protein n=1 Tax=Physocladia obscura TaxID=109957 RepID=A0AAD5SRX3_9FUNG|nr:hypothetical protein HK100_005217 [Physocladia obscura]
MYSGTAFFADSEFKTTTSVVMTPSESVGQPKSENTQLPTKSIITATTTRTNSAAQTSTAAFSCDDVCLAQPGTWPTYYRGIGTCAASSTTEIGNARFRNIAYVAVMAWNTACSTAVAAEEVGLASGNTAGLLYVEMHPMYTYLAFASVKVPSSGAKTFTWVASDAYLATTAQFGSTIDGGVRYVAVTRYANTARDDGGVIGVQITAVGACYSALGSWNNSYVEATRVVVETDSSDGTVGVIGTSSCGGGGEREVLVKYYRDNQCLDFVYSKSVGAIGGGNGCEGESNGGQVRFQWRRILVMQLVALMRVIMNGHVQEGGGDGFLEYVWLL